MVLDFANKWHIGQTIRVKFLNGNDDSLFEKVKSLAKTWENYANIKFQFVEPEDHAEIRIKFGETSTDSKIGTDCLTEPSDSSTMNYIGSSIGGLTDAHVIHEFGHALGLTHEHLHPAINIKWNKKKTKEYYKNNFQYDDLMCENNIFRKYLRNQCQYSEFDVDSIMMYPVPSSITLDESEYKENEELSSLDKKFISIIYPQESPEIINLPANKDISNKLEEYGQEHIYKITAISEERPRYYINITGDTNVVLSLYTIETDGPKKGYINYITPFVETPLCENCSGVNAKIEYDLSPGEYFVIVKHFDPDGKGGYSINLNIV